MLSALHRDLEGLRAGDFEAACLAVFDYQRRHNVLYAAFLRDLNLGGAWRPRCREEIPFLPISAFKREWVKTGVWEAERIFLSSGTTGLRPSQHALRCGDWYRRRARACWAYAYGASVSNWAFFALLPSYLERGHSSLVFMVQDFIEQSSGGNSGFFLEAGEALLEAIAGARGAGRPFVLWGVSYALLDLAERYPDLDLSDGIVLETGGMKGRRAEWPKAVLHEHLKKAFGLEQVHSEYGMTELLSQAYALADGIFECPLGMEVWFADPTDPLSLVEAGRVGQIKVIDLFNLDTCAFVATEDLGRSWGGGRFEVLGRLAGAELRGCNLLLA